MDIAPLFSFITPVSDAKHLLEPTLDSLRLQTERRFEIVLIDGIGHGKLEELIKPYEDLKIHIYPASGLTGSEMMNQGLKLAKGKYIQFLSAGDRYLSQEGLSYLLDLTKGDPHLIYSGFLIRGSETTLFPLDRTTLQKGVFSKDSWFLKQAVIDLGGLDATFPYRAAFELLCRLFLGANVRAVCSRRVLTDNEPKDPSPKAIIGYLSETYRILYRHFGLWTAIRWVFIQNHLQVLHRLGHHFKQAFWKRPFS